MIVDTTQIPTLACYYLSGVCTKIPWCHLLESLPPNRLLYSPVFGNFGAKSQQSIF